MLGIGGMYILYVMVFYFIVKRVVVIVVFVVEISSEVVRVIRFLIESVVK